MRKRAIAAMFIGGLTVAGLVFATWGASAHTASFDSTVTISQVDSHLKVHGHVESGPRFCQTDRDVEVFKVRRGPDKFIDDSNTGNDRIWGPVVVPKRGRYYARVLQAVRTSYGHDHTCLADRSGTIRVDR